MRNKRQKPFRIPRLGKDIYQATEKERFDWLNSILQMLKENQPDDCEGWLLIAVSEGDEGPQIQTSCNIRDEETLERIADVLAAAFDTGSMTEGV